MHAVENNQLVKIVKRTVVLSNKTDKPPATQLRKSDINDRSLYAVKLYTVTLFQRGYKCEQQLLS